MNKIRFITLLALATILVACTSSKSLYKKGMKLEEAGLSTEAADMYMQSLSKKNTNIDARIALKKTGQRVLNDQLDEFNRLQMLKDYDDAVYKFELADLFYNRVKAHNIDLQFPSHYKDAYEVALEHYLDELYDEGVSLYEQKNYAEATRKFNKIAGYNPTYKDINEYQVLTFAEPLYDNGMRAYENENWREAYGYFDRIYNKQPDFKDVSELRSLSLERGLFPVVIVPFENSSLDEDVCDRIHAHIVTEITNVDNPFLKIVDRDNIDQIIQEQTLGLSGVVDPSTAASVGNILGAKGLISGQVLKYDENKGKLKKKIVDAFEAYQVTESDPEGNETKVTKYKKVRYVEYYNKNDVHLTAQYKLVSLDNGEVLFTNIIEKEEVDEIHFAVYQGPKENLIPSKDGKPTTIRAEYDALQNLLKARNELLATDEIAVDLYKLVGTQVAKEMEDYLHY